MLFLGKKFEETRMHDVSSFANSSKRYSISINYATANNVLTHLPDSFTVRVND